MYEGDVHIGNRTGSQAGLALNSQKVHPSQTNGTCCPTRELGDNCNSTTKGAGRMPIFRNIKHKHRYKGWNDICVFNTPESDSDDSQEDNLLFKMEIEGEANMNSKSDSGSSIVEDSELTDASVSVASISAQRRVRNMRLINSHLIGGGNDESDSITDSDSECTCKETESSDVRVERELGKKHSGNRCNMSLHCVVCSKSFDAKDVDGVLVCSDKCGALRAKQQQRIQACQPNTLPTSALAARVNSIALSGNAKHVNKVKGRAQTTPEVDARPPFVILTEKGRREILEKEKKSFPYGVAYRFYAEEDEGYLSKHYAKLREVKKR